MPRAEKVLISTQTGEFVRGPRLFDIPGDESILEQVPSGLAWVDRIEGPKLQARRGETVVRKRIAEPLPYQEGVTKFFDGWKVTGTYQPPTQEELDAGQAAKDDARANSLSNDDLITVLLAIVNEERTNRTPPADSITREQFIQYCKNQLGIGS